MSPSHSSSCYSGEIPLPLRPYLISSADSSWRAGMSTSGPGPVAWTGNGTMGDSPMKPPSRLPPLLAAALASLVGGLVGPGHAAAADSRPHPTVTPLFRAAEASAPPELLISFAEAEVLAAELTPGGDAVFWSVGREPLGYVQRVVRHQGVEVVDALGEARFTPETGAVLLKSVWAVAEVATGAVAIAAPPGFVLREIPFPGNGFAVGAPGRVNRLRHPKSSLDLLMIRPGVGAWRLRAQDTGLADHDGEDDDQVMTDLDDLEPFDPAGPQPPERYARDDVIVVIDPHDLTYYATRLLGPPAPGEEEP